jgi:hypothetical protein
MKCGPKPTPAIMVIRMKPLPRRHRIAHLLTLIRQQPVRSIRRKNLLHCCAMTCWRGSAKKHARYEPANVALRIAVPHSNFTT